MADPQEIAALEAHAQDLRDTIAGLEHQLSETRKKAQKNVDDFKADVTAALQAEFDKKVAEIRRDYAAMVDKLNEQKASVEKWEAQVRAQENKAKALDAELFQKQITLNKTEEVLAELEAGQRKREKQIEDEKVSVFNRENALEVSKSAFSDIVRNKESELARGALNLKAREDQVIAAERELNERFEAVRILEEKLSHKEAVLLERENVVTQKEQYLSSDAQAHKELIESLNAQETRIKEDSEKLKVDLEKQGAQSKLLAQKEAENHEKEQSLKEREKLIELKLREIDGKIVILNKLRAGNG